ncbi:hypothetical protein EDD85DRAFT_808666 [Armillaria nabsnona]|nr:hypothetical protein EDD85DRAFT_808666 [Armillaria nabsnona]
MANIIRSAKSGHEWTYNKMEAYNIRITFQDAQTFFDEAPYQHPPFTRRSSRPLPLTMQSKTRPTT